MFCIWIQLSVADFGTSRVNTEQQAGILRTRELTHASTHQVCGTSVYMPPEYMTRGQVSCRTDAFAFGIVMIELMASLTPTAVRTDIIDDAIFDEIPALIQEFHDKAVKDRKGCEWPPLILEQLGVLAAKCCYLQAKRRAAISEVLPELEALLGGPAEWQ
jgi:serine/threonine protein kinase